MADFQVEKLTKRLRSRVTLSRVKAAEALGKLGDTSAVPALIQAMNDRSVHVRSSAADALGRIRDTSAVPAVVEALNDESEFVRQRAAAALVKIGVPAIAALIGALENTSEFVRSRAAEALGQVGNSSAAPALIGALRDESSLVRWLAIIALDQVGDVATTPACIDALNDDEYLVRQAAAEILGRYPHALVISALISTLGDVSNSVRRSAVESLNRIGSHAIPAIVAALMAADVDLRKAAGESFGKYGDPERLPRMILADTRFSAQERTNALQRLLNGGCKFPGTRALCELVLNETDVATREGAELVLKWLNGDQHLLVASQRDAAAEAEELVRPVHEVAFEGQQETLLRSAHGSR